MWEERRNWSFLGFPSHTGSCEEEEDGGMYGDCAKRTGWIACEQHFARKGKCLAVRQWSLLLSIICPQCKHASSKGWYPCDTKKWVARSLFIRIVDFHTKRDKQKGNTHTGIILGCDRETGCTKPVNIYIMRAHPTLQLQQSRAYICGDSRA